MSHETARQYARHLNQTLAPQPAVETLSWIFHKTRDAAFLEACAERLKDFQDDLPLFNNLLWNVNRLCFTQAGHLADQLAVIRYEHLVPAYFRLVDRLRATLEIPLPASRPPEGAARRLLYVSHQIFMVQHAPTKVCLDYCAELRVQGHEVLVVNQNLLPDDDPLRFAGGLKANVNPQLTGLQPVAHRGHVVPVFSLLPAGLSRDKLAAALRAVKEFRPDGVLSHGEFNILGDLLAGSFPVVCLPSGTWEPVSRALGWIDYTSGLGRLEAVERGLLPVPPMIRRLSNVSPVPPRQATLRRDGFGLRDDQKILALVGNRLPDDIDEDCEQSLARILERVPQAALLMVGQDRMAWRTRHLEPFAGRIRCAGFQNDLRAALALCDVFLNPRRPGGGMSAMSALHEDLPVVTLFHGDVGVILGQDRCCGNWEEWTARAIALATDPAAMKQGRAQARAVLAEGPGFPGVIRELMDFEREVEKVFWKEKSGPGAA